jgi:hypothetical protein
MSRVNDKHAMERKPGRSRIDVPDSSQKERCHQLAIGNPLPELFHQHLGTALTRRALEQIDKWFDLRTKLHEAGSHLGLVLTDQKRTRERSGNTTQRSAGKSANNTAS